MEFDTEILCIDRNGKQNKFKYSKEEIEEDETVKWVFKVMPFDLNATDWFEFAITFINPTIGKVTVMDNRNMAQYRGKGITERMIVEAANVSGLTIISSTNNPEMKSLSTEWRTTSANVIWERLRTQGQANYNEESDIYTYINNKI